MKQTFSKFDRFIMAFHKVLIITVHDLQKQLFFFKGACLFKTSKKIFSKGAYSSADSVESLY